MKVYPCGYSTHSALIAALMEAHPNLLLIDIRMKPYSRMAAWQRTTLYQTYEDRYGWLGATLGNVNYKTGGPIRLADPQAGIAHLIKLLQAGYDVLLLCGCRDYQACHRRTVVELLTGQLRGVEVIQPEPAEFAGESQTLEYIRCLSIRQPWAWLITHPEAVKACQLPPKTIENREWTPTYRGRILIHAGAAVDSSLFTSKGALSRRYWECAFGSAGVALYNAMPQHRDDYPRRAILGQAQLSDVLTESLDPWFVGPYGLVLTNATAISPISYPGQLRLFDVPASLIEQR